jgi:hypothetical protein
VQTVCVRQPKAAVITEMGAFWQVNLAARTGRHQHGTTLLTKICLRPVGCLAAWAGFELHHAQRHASNSFDV